MDDPVDRFAEIMDDDARFPSKPGDDLETVQEQETGRVALYDPDLGSSAWIGFQPGKDTVPAKP